MDQDDTRGLLKSILGFFARKKPEKSTPPTSFESQTLDAWVRTDAYLQHNADDLDEIDSDQVARTLKALENLVQYDSDRRFDSESHHAVPYPKLQAVRSMLERPNYYAHPNPGTNIRLSKRKREIDAAIEELSHLDMEAKKRRVLPREESNVGDDIDELEADFAMLMRKHLVSFYHGLRLSVRLSLPQRKKGPNIDSCFEVFFGIRSLLTITLQEAKITVKDEQNDKALSATELIPSVLPEFAHICQCITESLNQRNCLHLLFEDGLFRRLRPQPKTFDDSHIPRTVSLSALFRRQQELHGGLSALSLKGKRILAVTLATALLPFLETPWVQPSFNHSNIQFFQPLQDGELPNITKPFLAMEHVPIVRANKIGTGNSQAEEASSKHMVHPNASVLALGILLCELHYCTPVESWQNETETNRNVNTDYYTSLEILQNLEVDAGADYYLATKACLQWEYYPAGEPADFESASVQKLFYQNVIKRLESEIFKSWRLRLEDLDSLDSRENELCWGLIGREVVRQQTSKPEVSARINKESVVSLPSAPKYTSRSYNSYNPALVLQMPTQHSRGLHNRPLFTESSAKSLQFFDASHQTVSEQK
ncbi:hypothetical protein N0V90_001844 [Kalmusia sp. IMI 367209]|nr:hypothetical protein N0V90_001844 [Kalmusia sp. IMI 367209]